MHTFYIVILILFIGPIYIYKYSIKPSQLPSDVTSFPPSMDQNSKPSTVRSFEPISLPSGVPSASPSSGLSFKLSQSPSYVPSSIPIKYM